jgi:predicted RecA/RadA family phage recombinase
MNMAKNFVQPGNVLTITAGGSVASGSPVPIGDLIGIALNAAVTGETVDLRLDGVWELPKVSADTITAGQSVYWDAGNNLVTETASTHQKLGHAVAAAGNGAGTVRVRLAN